PVRVVPACHPPRSRSFPSDAISRRVFDRPRSSGAGGKPHGAAHARAAAPAVAPWVLREVLLVIVLGVVEVGSLADLRGDGLVAGLAQHALIRLLRGEGGLELRV